MYMNSFQMYTNIATIFLQKYKQPLRPNKNAHFILDIIKILDINPFLNLQILLSLLLPMLIFLRFLPFVNT